MAGRFTGGILMTIRQITYASGFEPVYSASPLGWAMVQDPYTPNEVTDLFMDSVAPDEFTGVGYARVVAAGATVSVVTPVTTGGPGFVQWVYDNPDFGVMSGGAVATGVVLFGDTGVDASSPIVAVYPVAYTADGTTDALFTLNSSGAVVVATVCPSGI